MVSIKKSVTALLPPPKIGLELALKGAKLGLTYGAKIAGGAVGTASTLYLQYLVAQSAFDVVSGYAGQYHELKDGYQKVGFTPKEMGTLFASIGDSGNSWNVLSYTFDRESILEVQSILHQIYEHIESPEILQAMTAQIITKVLVNKNAEFLQEGHEIEIPTIDSNGQKKLVPYILDKKFDLWEGVPAYGFVDKSNENPPLLVFRSTNTVFEEKDTLPTLVANLHPKGPAWKLFSHSEREIQGWLEDKLKESKEKATVMGYSQGGVLGSYFLTYHSKYFSDKEHQPSLILDAPGVSSKVAKDWRSVEGKPNVKVYVNRGDLVPKVGDSFIGRAFEVRISQNLKGFQSHKALSLFAPQWKIVEIAVQEESGSTSRGILSTIQKVLGKAIYTPVKMLLLPCLQSLRG